MTKFQAFRIKNAMMFMNLISNGIGVLVLMFLVHRIGEPPSAEVVALSNRIHTYFLPLSLVVPLIATLLYERPVRRFLHIFSRGKTHLETAPEDVKRRVLNEPFFLIALDFAVWLVASFLYPLVFRLSGIQDAPITETFFRNIYTGLITTTIAFFVLEFVLQRRVVPHLFPNGRLSMTPRTIRIRIRTRLVAFLFACNLVPLFSVISQFGLTSISGGDPARTLADMKSRLPAEAVVFMGAGIWLTILVSSNITRPLQEIIQVLRGVRRGDFDRSVRVTSNDEIGYTGDVINEMTQGLKERDFIKETFGKYVTEEIRDEILSGHLSLDGELRRVTVLFADLRNFTPFVERTPPREVVKILNGYFREMEEAIRNHHGLVIQYIGDEIEAVFGAPIRREDHSVMAVRAAMEMAERLKRLNQRLYETGHAPLAHGIGIHTGEVVAANIGSPDRLSYALVGDTVNLASRLQGLTKGLETNIVISRATQEALPEGLPVRPLPTVSVKGKSGPIEVYGLG